MTRGQFTRRLKKARRASKRLANDRSHQGQDNAARWIATMRKLAADRQSDQTNDLIGRDG